MSNVDAIRAVDKENELDAVLALPDHLRDALWRIESAKLKPVDAPTTVICGMGGSAIGGDLAQAALGSRLGRPLVSARGYELPPAARPDSLVVCSSYSGNTEETLACYEGAEALGATRIVATTNGKLAELARADDVPVIGLPAGLQPRASVGYMFTVAAETAALGGGAERLNTEIDSSAAHLEERRDALIDQAAEIAAGLADCTTVINGCGLTAPVAYRWKCQLNENAEVPAFWGVLPEADHNEICGFAGMGRLGRDAHVVMLRDPRNHRQVERRFDLTRELVAPEVRDVTGIEAEGQSPLARMLDLVMLGDYASIYLAFLRDVDPGPVGMIDRLKERLATTGHGRAQGPAA
jgi:glucose/mannose-6-phosphate isomerase